MIEYEYLFQYFGRMKKFIILGFLCFAFLSVFGQFENAVEEVSYFKKTLNIEPDQITSLEKIIERKYADIASISSLRNGEESVFRQKRRSIYEGANSAIRLLVKEDQLQLWRAYKKEERLKNAQKIKDLQSKGAPEEDLLDAQFGIIN
jgi:hypothetical protein